MGEHDALLTKYQPRLKYDSQEAFFADSAAEWTDNPDNVLRRSDADGRTGEVLAAATPVAGEQQLRLGFLGHPTYADGTPAQAVQKDGGDQIGARSRRDYREMYDQLRRTDDYRNRMYGRAKEDSYGRLWLQYWFFFFYNDYNLAGGFGLHEGDWEMVQFRMGATEPELAVYAQHRQAQQATWDQVEFLKGSPDTPLVYVGRGSHASYFNAGYHETEAWYDMADGERRTPKLKLEIIGDTEPSWVTWRGRWGDTHPRIPDLEQPSPSGPCMHSQWDDPSRLLTDVRSYAPALKPRQAPEVEVRRIDGRLVVNVDFSTHPVRVERVVVTVNSRNEPRSPRAFTFALEQALRGRIETRLMLDPSWHYDISVSAIGSDGRPSEARLHLIDPVAPRPPLLRRLVPRVAKLVARIRGD